LDDKIEDILNNPQSLCYALTLNGRKVTTDNPL